MTEHPRFRKFLWYFFKTLSVLFFPVKLEGRLPEGAYVLALNHQSFLDAIAVFLVLVRKLKDRSKFFERMNGILEGFLVGFKTFSQVKNKVLFLLYSVMIWVMYMLMSYFVLKAIPQLSQALMADGLFVASLGNIASLVPVPGGIGAYHYLLKVSLMGLYGTTDEIGLLFATLCHELHAVLVIVLGVWSYIFRIVILKNGNAPKVGSASRKN